ncbi:MAG: flagellar basal body L-ring protein FlgH [Spirochaetales bacterium]|nr:flagellar basal body L-ring protein FlgH [Spirochaetales bacterium]
MRIKYLLFLLLICCVLSANGESLWDDDFRGYLSGEKMLQEGDIVIVEIDTSLSLSFISASKDSKNMTFNFSGGDYGHIFSFLPLAQTQADYSARGNEKYSFSTTLVTRIIRIEDDRHVSIEGARSISFDGKEESLRLSGYIDVRDLDGERKIPFSKIADSRLVFQSFMIPGSDILSAGDIEELFSGMENALTGEPESAGAGPEEGGPAAETAMTSTGTGTGIRKVSLSDEKKRELFLRYINKLIDLLFQ